MSRIKWANRKLQRRGVVIPSAAELRARIKPLPAQQRFFDAFDEHAFKYVAFVGGVGSGKSHIGAHYAIEKAARNPQVRGFIGANTYPQLWQSSLTRLFALCKEYGVPVRPETPEAAAKKKVLYLWDSVEILCRSAERFQDWDGFEVGWFWLDEAKDMQERAFITINERHRDNRVDVLEGWLSTSPSGMNWVYELGDSPEALIINAHTKENVNLPVGYVESLLSKMSDELARQQLGGEFLNVYSGQAYPAFSRVENGGQQSAVSGQPLIVGVDFNVEPGMHAEVMQIVGEAVFVLDEIYIKGGNTPMLAKEIERRFGTEGVVVHPDAAGGHRSTTGTSDHQILRDAGFKVVCRAANPPIKNRINSVNGRILNALGERRLFVDPSCKLLIKDLEQCTWEVMLTASYKGPLTHPGAALGYPVEYKFPVTDQGFARLLPKRF